LAAKSLPKCLLGDKAYDSGALRNFLKTNKSIAVIPPKTSWHNPPEYDPVLYRQRNLIERAFNRLKDWRAIATRYDKKAANFLAGVCLAVACIWWIK
jgi:putative transposase